jgi:hypothetical protein
MSMPDNNSLSNPGDNMTYWTQKFPSLLPKNMMTLARFFDQEHPPFTFQVLPPRNVKWNFQWPVIINPSAIAEEVDEGAEAPLMDAQEKIESFYCREFRLATKITKRLIDFGIHNVVRSKIQFLTEAVEKAREYLNVLALTGTNRNQSVERLNKFKAGTGTGGTAKKWNESGAKILDDIIDMKDKIEKLSGRVPTTLYVPTDEYTAMQKDSEIIDQLKYTDKSLLNNGEIMVVKGIRIQKVSNFFKDRKKTQEDDRIYLLEGKCIMTTNNVGFTGIAEPMRGSAPEVERWWEMSQRSIFIQAVSSFVPVIEDYSRVGIIEDTT